MTAESISQIMAQLSVTQMEARSKAFSDAATLLRAREPGSADDVDQGSAVAAWLDDEASKWLARADRSRDVLSVAQRRTFDHFQRFLREHGRSPTVTDLARIDGVSPASVNPRIDVLVLKGFLTKIPHTRSGLALNPQANTGIEEPST